MLFPNVPFPDFNCPMNYEPSSNSEAVLNWNTTTNNSYTDFILTYDFSNNSINFLDGSLYIGNKIRESPFYFDALASSNSQAPDYYFYLRSTYMEFNVSNFNYYVNQADDFFRNNHSTYVLDGLTYNLAFVPSEHDNGYVKDTNDPAIGLYSKAGFLDSMKKNTIGYYGNLGGFTSTAIRHYDVYALYYHYVNVGYEYYNKTIVYDNLTIKIVKKINISTGYIIYYLYVTSTKSNTTDCLRYCLDKQKYNLIY